MYDILFISNGQSSDTAWEELHTRFPRAQRLENIDSFEILKNTSLTRFFYAVWDDIKIAEDFNFDYKIPSWDEQYIHVFKNGNFYDGVILFSKDHHVSKKEFDYRFFSNKKELDIIASQPRTFNKFNISSYQEYLDAAKASTTNMFWSIWSDVELTGELNYQVPRYNQHITHVFKNDNYFDGVCLFNKNNLISEKEFKHRFFIEKKEIDVIISYPKPLNYEIVFISYGEPNAEENFLKLTKRFPNVKRIDGVKGIHRAHIQAASLVSTQMFYVVDGDAEVFDNFNFDFYVPTFQRDIVHVWQSVNPINNLIYGYGGVKLLPRDKVLSMSTETVDMTLKISDKFKCVPEISNLTRFNTDEFNTWKSAFRECVKLASKPIDENYDEENDRRLKIWCSVGENQPYGRIAIEGAIEGKKYGYAHIYNHEQLYKINDFDWLKSIYEQRTQNHNT